MQRRRISCLIGWGLGLTLLGCAPVARFQRQAAAELDLYGFSRIQVGTMNAQEGAELSARVLDALQHSRRFELADATATSHRAKTSPAAARAAGRRLEPRNPRMHAAPRAPQAGAASASAGSPSATDGWALLTGDQLERSFQVIGTRRGNRCTKPVEKDGKVVQEAIPCEQQACTATYKVAFRLTNAAKGTLLAQRTLERYFDGERWLRFSMPSDQTKNPCLKPDQIFADLAAGLAEELVEQMVPHERTEVVKLARAGLRGPLVEGNREAKRGRFREGVEAYQRGIDALERADQGDSRAAAKLYYNQGVALAAQGEYARSLERLDDALTVRKPRAWVRTRDAVLRFKEESDRARRQLESSPVP